MCFFYLLHINLVLTKWHKYVKILKERWEQSGKYLKRMGKTMALDLDELEEDDFFDEEDENTQIHMYVDGTKAYLLEDEELDKLSRIKNDLYDNLGEMYVKEENFNKLKSAVNGAFWGVFAVLDVGLFTDAFANSLFTYSTLGIFGTTVASKAVMWRKNKKIQNRINELEDNYDTANKAYKAKNEEVAGKLIDKDEAHHKAYL